MLSGRIRFSRINGGSGDWIEISVEDEMSGRQIVMVEMDFFEVGKMMSGLGADCEFKLTNLDKVGKKHEVTTRLVPVPDQVYSLTKDKEREYLKQFETDGWTADTGDLLNHHNQIRETSNGGKLMARVHFRRFV